MTNKCDIVSKEMYLGGSLTNGLATANQLLAEYQRDNDGSVVSTKSMEVVKNIIREDISKIKKKYPTSSIDNIVWDDYTKCKSQVPSGHDSVGNPIYKNINRHDLIEDAGYKPNPKYFKGAGKSLAVLSPYNHWIPIRYDIYAPPEVFLLIVVIVIFLAISLAVYVRINLNTGNK